VRRIYKIGKFDNVFPIDEDTVDKEIQSKKKNLKLNV